MMMIFDYFLLRGWSLEQILALGVSLGTALGVIGFMNLLRLADQDRARSLGFALVPPAPAPLPPLPTRPPHEHAWIPARTPDGDDRDLCSGCGARRFPVPSKAAATVFVAGAPRGTVLLLADDSIPLADIPVEDFGFVAEVLAAIDGEFRDDKGAGQ